MATLTPKSIFTYALSTLRMRWVKEVQTFFKPLTFPEETINEATQEFAGTIPKNIMVAFNGRFERGIKMAKQGMVSNFKDPIGPDRKRLFRVRSSNSYQPPYSYIVDLDNERCECPDHIKGHFCKHRVASHIIEIVIQKTQKFEVSEPIEAEPKSEPGNSKVIEVEQSQPKGETIIWAVIRHNGEILGVEVLNIEEDNATVRALPKIKNGKKLLPQFPFEGGKSSLDILRRV